MDRHVIKGRGEHRGEYLCWARMAPEATPTEDGFVWLSEQCKAVRWRDPRYSGRTWATDRARIHDGYFVKLVAPASFTRDVVRELQVFICERAAGATKAVDCHWFDGDFHAGADFCLPCAKRVVDEKYAADPVAFAEMYGEHEDPEDRYREVIDGGEIDHGSPPECETCGAKLRGHLSEDGADQEIDALTSDCAPDISDIEGWAALAHALVNVSDDDPRWRKIAKVVEAARAALRDAGGVPC